MELPEISRSAGRAFRWVRMLKHGGILKMMQFLAVNAVFVVIFIAMAAHPVKSLAAWAAFIALWCAADIYFANGIHLKWWQWAGLIGILAVIDLTVIRFA